MDDKALIAHVGAGGKVGAEETLPPGYRGELVMNMLMGTASAAQLRELRECSYGPLAEAMDAIVPQESRHARLGENGLREALERGTSVNGVQSLVDYWYPRVADTFGRTDSDRFDLYRRYGLRRHSNAGLLAAWEGEMGDRLGRLGLTLPGGAGPAQ